MKTKRIKNSIKVRILAPMLVFLVLQTIVILFIFFASNIVKISTNNAYEAFNEKVTTRKTYTEKEMMQRFASVDNAISNIDYIIAGMIKDGSTSGHAENRANVFLTRTVPLLIDTIKNNGVTGAYIILAENETNYSALDGLYLRCETPLAVYPESLYINVANDYVRENALAGNATGETNELKHFDFSDKSSEYDYFFKPYNAVISSGMATQANTYYAYWSTPHQVLLGGNKVLSYSIPLFYNNRLYGIFGIDVSLRYMEKYFPPQELNTDNQAAYALCSGGASKNSYKTMVKNGTWYNKILGDSQTINLSPNSKSDYKNNYVIDADKKSKDDCSVCVEPLHLYANNSYFINEQMSLIGMINTDVIMLFTNNMTKTITLSLLLTDVAGTILVALVAMYISRPVAKLPEKIDAYSRNTDNQIQRTGIYEIDKLITSIERLSCTVEQNASKMSQIIELTGAPLGAFELNKIDNTLIFTDKVSLITCNSMLCTGKISVADFLAYLKAIENNRVETDDNSKLYSFINDSGETHFITMQSVETDDYLIGVLQDVTKERIERKSIEYERDYDVLTTLLNRRAFWAAGKRLFSKSEDIGFSALLLIDMDNLKIINDTFGHEQGDEYLRAMAKTLKAFLSECKVYISRYSGDEYVILLYGYDSKEKLKEEIDRLEKYVGESYMLMANNQKVKLRCSGGVAFYPDDASNLDELICYADYAMYEIKQTTKGKFNLFNKVTYSTREYRTQNYEKLNLLIEKNLVDYYYQPVVCLKTGKILGYEALMRSLEPSFSNPQEILNVATAQHKLYYIERLTWFNALEKYMERQPADLSRLLFINSIPSHILTDSDIELLECKYLDLLGRVVIEFTEAEKLNEDYATHKKEKIKGWGGKVALDDFGAGYSNDAVLLILNPNYIKIDMFIVRDCDTNQSKCKLMQNIVAYASERKIKVIAEGVETRAELETIMRCNVDLVQGFYVAKPNRIPQEIDRGKQQEIISLDAMIRPVSNPFHDV